MPERCRVSESAVFESLPNRNNFSQSIGDKNLGKQYHQKCGLFPQIVPIRRIARHCILFKWPNELFEKGCFPATLKWLSKQSRDARPS
jgi:hypothetical protein